MKVLGFFVAYALMASTALAQKIRGSTGSRRLSSNSLTVRGLVEKFDWEITPEAGYPIIAFDSANADSEVVFLYNYTGTLVQDQKYIGAKIFLSDCVTESEDESLTLIKTDGENEIQLDVDIVQASIAESVYYSDTSDTSATISFCVRVDYYYKDAAGEEMSINFHETAVDITVDLTANFTLTGISTSRDAADMLDEEANVDCDVVAYYCDDSNALTEARTLAQGDVLQFCVEVAAEDAGNLWVRDIMSTDLEQDNNANGQYREEGIDMFDDIVENYEGNPLTSKTCSGGVCNIKTQLSSKYFSSPNPKPLDIMGSAVCAFGVAPIGLTGVGIPYGLMNQEEASASGTDAEEGAAASGTSAESSSSSTTTTIGPYDLFSVVGGDELEDSNPQANAREGIATAVSADGTFMAVGADNYNVSTGRVRLFQWNSDTESWDLHQELTGNTAGASFGGGAGALSADGFTTGVMFGGAVALSADGLTLAVGATWTYVYYDFMGYKHYPEKGAVHIYTRTQGGQFTEFQYIEGEVDQARIGSGVDLSSDGKRLLVCAVARSVGLANGSGEARVYELNGSQYYLMGSPFSHPLPSGSSFSQGHSISGDGSTLALGMPRTSDGTGRAWIYNWDGSQWKSTFEFALPGSVNFGGSTSLNADGSIVAITTRHLSGIKNGETLVFAKSQAGEWARLGSTFAPGEANGDYGLNYATADLAMDATGNFVAVGTYEYYTATGDMQYSGKVQLWSFDGAIGDWIIVGDKYGTMKNDRLGCSVALAYDSANVLVAGGYGYTVNGVAGAGHVVPIYVAQS